MVDDMLIFNSINYLETIKLLDDPKVYCVHLKLYPGITYSHTNNKLMSPPKFESIDEELKYLKFRRSETEMDWNYPFDFCGSLYRLESILQVIKHVEDKKSLL